MMLALFALIAVFCLVGIKASPKGFYSDYLGKDQTTAIRGIFILIIFLSHLKGYLTLTSVPDSIYLKINAQIGQMMVAPFFFISGYGVVSAYLNKKNYDKKFFKNRIFKTWLHFATAIVIYFVLSLILKSGYSVKDIILSFTGWSAIGNSNWFIFDTLILYFIAFIAFKIANRFEKSGEKKLILISVITALTLAFVLGIGYFKDYYWRDTVFVFPIGVIYGVVKDKIDRYAKNNGVFYTVLLSLVISFFCIKKFGGIIPYNIMSCLFVLLITAVTAKVKIKNKILMIVGKYSFFIYIYMRIPMNILSHFKITNIYIFAAVSVVATAFIVFVMKFLQDKLDSVIFKNAEVKQQNG